MEFLRVQIFNNQSVFKYIKTTKQGIIFSRKSQPRNFGNYSNFFTDNINSSFRKVLGQVYTQSELKYESQVRAIQIPKYFADELEIFVLLLF